MRTAMHTRALDSTWLDPVDANAARAVRVPNDFDDFPSITYMFDNIPSSVHLPNTRRSACPLGRVPGGPVVVR